MSTITATIAKRTVTEYFGDIGADGAGVTVETVYAVSGVYLTGHSSERTAEVGDVTVTHYLAHGEEVPPVGPNEYLSLRGYVLTKRGTRNKTRGFTRLSGDGRLTAEDMLRLVAALNAAVPAQPEVAA